VMVRMKKRIKL